MNRINVLVLLGLLFILSSNASADHRDMRRADAGYDNHHGGHYYTNHYRHPGHRRRGHSHHRYARHHRHDGAWHAGIHYPGAGLVIVYQPRSDQSGYRGH